MNANDVPRFWYRGTVTAVHDGDTFQLLAQLGLLVSVQATIRILFANAPEITGETITPATTTPPRRPSHDRITGTPAPSRR